MDSRDSEPDVDLKDAHPDLSNDGQLEEDEDVAMQDGQNDAEGGRTMKQRKQSFGTAFPCKFCSHSYRALGSLSSHMRNIHPHELNQMNKFPCRYDGCEKVLPTDMGRKLHERIHKGKEMTVKKDPAAHSLTGRNGRTIRPPKRYSEERLLENTSLKVVVKSSELSTSSDSKIKCMICNELFKSQYHLDLHNERDHKRNFCGVCGELFRDKAARSLHEKQCHEGLKATSDAPINDDVTCLTDSNGKFTTPPSRVGTPESEVNKPNGPSGISAPPPSPVSNAALDLLETDHQISAVAISEKLADTGTIEKSSLPLSAGIFFKSKDDATSMMLIWSKTLDDDLLSAASHNKRNTILCIQDMDFYDMSNLQKTKLADGQRMNFVILEPSCEYSSWTVMTFGDPIAPLGLKNTSFKTLLEVEKIIVEHAGYQGMDLVNVLRYTEDGFHNNISQKLSKKILLFNCTE